MLVCGGIVKCVSKHCGCIHSLIQLMYDEYEQKCERLIALEEKVNELKKKQGEFNLSGKYGGVVRAHTVDVKKFYKIIHRTSFQSSFIR